MAENGNISLGLAVSVIAGEHMFSAGLSSPWSVAKFAKTQEDQDAVWRLFWYATGASVIFAVVIGQMLGGGRTTVFAVTGAAAVSAFMGYEYWAALNGTL